MFMFRKKRDHPLSMLVSPFMTVVEDGEKKPLRLEPLIRVGKGRHAGPDVDRIVLSYLPQEEEFKLNPGILDVDSPEFSTRFNLTIGRDSPLNLQAFLTNGLLPRKFPRLTSLDLTRNKIGPDGARALKLPKSLTRLNLRYNEIGDEGTRALKLPLDLSTLILWGNEIGPDGARDLQNRYPNLDIQL